MSNCWSHKENNSRLFEIWKEENKIHACPAVYHAKKTTPVCLNVCNRKQSMTRQRMNRVTYITGNPPYCRSNFADFFQLFTNFSRAFGLLHFHSIELRRNIFHMWNKKFLVLDDCTFFERQYQNMEKKRFRRAKTFQ